MKIKNTRSALSWTLVCATCLAYFNNSLQPARAEGDRVFAGAQGVNRVIRSEPGAHTTVSGTGTMNFSNVPANGGRHWILEC